MKKQKHKFKIISLHDAKATCLCGWSLTCTGERTKPYLKKEYKRHLK